MDKFLECMVYRKPDNYKTHAKLICYCSDEFGYLFHHRRLKFLIRQGTEIEKVNRVISVKQDAWFASHINLNTIKRAAINDTLKSFF